jgi:hypothetical protein
MKILQNYKAMYLGYSFTLKASIISFNLGFLHALSDYTVGSMHVPFLPVPITIPIKKILLEFDRGQAY